MSDRRTQHYASIVGLTVCLGFGLAMPASAIECVNGFQRSGGNLIATPYCQDALLAKVANEYGMPASAAHIRNNPNYKKEVCRLVGQDIRVQEHCLDVLPHPRGAR